MIEAISDSPAMRSLLAAWAQLSDENKAVFEKFAADYVEDYNRRTGDEKNLRAKAAIEQAEARLPDAAQNQA